MTFLEVTETIEQDEKKRYADLQAENASLREACIGVSTSLIAAIWLLKNGGKKAAGSDKIFEISVADYERSLDAARAVLYKKETSNE